MEGFGFSDNDVLRLVEGTSCEEGVVKEVPVYASSPMEAYVMDLVVESAADKVYTLCWKFDTEAYTFMSKYTVMVNDVTPDLFEFITVMVKDVVVQLREGREETRL